MSNQTKLRYVDVTFNFHGKDKDGNTVILPLQTEQTVIGTLIENSDDKRFRYGTLVVAGNRFSGICLDSFLHV
jgi:hypothetical protein